MIQGLVDTYCYNINSSCRDLLKVRHGQKLDLRSYSNKPIFIKGGNKLDRMKVNSDTSREFYESRTKHYG
jgi:hypothetical protein